MASCQFIYKYSVTIWNYLQYHPVIVMPNHISNNVLEVGYQTTFSHFTSLHLYHSLLQTNWGFQLFILQTELSDLLSDPPMLTSRQPNFCLGLHTGIQTRPKYSNTSTLPSPGSERPFYTAAAMLKTATSRSRNTG